MDNSTPDYPTAQKPHRCFGCREWIMPGEHYERQTVFDGGTAYTIKLCAKCLYASGWLSAGDTYGEGDLAEEHKHLPDDYKSVMESRVKEYNERKGYKMISTDKQKKKLLRLLKNSTKKERDSYTKDSVISWICFQLRTMLSERGIIYHQLSKMTGIPLRRLVNLDFESSGIAPNMNDLIKIANALDVCLRVEFCSFTDEVMRDKSPAALNVTRWGKEIDQNA